MLEKELESQGCGQQLKSYIHTPKPQILKCRTKEKNIGFKNNTLCFQLREKSRGFDVFFVFGREEKCVEYVQTESRTKGDLSFLGLKGAWGLLQPRHTLRGSGLSRILLATSTFSVHTVYSVCHIRFFYYWLDSRDQNKNDFLKLGTDLGAKPIQGPNQESAQNVGTKSAFLPLIYLEHIKILI